MGGKERRRKKKKKRKKKKNVKQTRDDFSYCPNFCKQYDQAV